MSKKLKKYDSISAMESDNGKVKYFVGKVSDSNGTIMCYLGDEEMKMFQNGNPFIISTEQPNNQIWYTSSDGQIVEPSELSPTSNTYVDGKGIMTFAEDVTTIPEYAFYEKEKLTGVSLPSSVTTIEDGAFYECSALTAIFIPKSVTSIGEYAFYYCPSMTSMKVDAENTTFDSRDNCNAIIRKEDNALLFGCNTSVIPSSVTKIGQYAFSYSEMTSLTIPDGVTEIEMYAFDSCYEIANITIPSSVTSIDSSSFNYCNLKSTNFVNNSQVEGSPWGAYLYEDEINGMLIDGTKVCDSRYLPTSFDIPQGITEIGTSAFAYHQKLESVTMADSVTTIGRQAFDSCRSLSSISISNNVTSIGNYAFRECPLTSVVLPNALTSLGTGAFSNCTALVSINIPNGLTAISNETFNGCSALTEITLPTSITSLNPFSFKNCTALVTFNYLGTMEQWNAINKYTGAWDWKENLAATVVHCSDGDVAL